MSVVSQVTSNFPLRPILSFVLREGRMTPAQKSAFDKHWPQYGLECPAQVAPIDFSDKPLVLEIGFGMGNSLLQQAIHSPDKQFIGIEVHRPGVGTLLNEIAKHNLKNLRIFNHNAIEVLNRAIPNHSLACVQLFFPDPWPKKRHHKRRIVQADFVTLIAQKLKPGGLFHMATDWAEYAEHMVSVMNENKDFRPVLNEEFKKIQIMRPKTKFENRGQALGHVISDLIYQI